ncbi:hypothetical protein [Streptomyces albogriseolus]|uniref:hypothetical protein n=1 Tax=Streptomyces albogriseolus TaxID=1887 RepID=UPI00345FB67F
MNNYLIRFDDGTSQNVQAASVEYIYDEGVFRFLDDDGKVIAWVPSLNVHCITDSKATAQRP